MDMGGITSQLYTWGSDRKHSFAENLSIICLRTKEFLARPSIFHDITVKLNAVAWAALSGDISLIENYLDHGHSLFLTILGVEQVVVAVAGAS